MLDKKSGFSISEKSFISAAQKQFQEQKTKYNVGKQHKSELVFPPDFVFGKPSEVDEWGAAECTKGLLKKYFFCISPQKYSFLILRIVNRSLSSKRTTSR